MVSRGSLGNAIKALIGYSYALSEHCRVAQAEIRVSSHGVEYGVTLDPDRVSEEIRSHVLERRVEDDGLNTFMVGFPAAETTQPAGSIVDSVIANHLVNQDRMFTYNVFGVEGVLGNGQ